MDIKDQLVSQTTSQLVMSLTDRLTSASQPVSLSVLDRSDRLISAFLGEMQRIAFRLMLSSCVCVCVCVCVCMPRLWSSGKRLEIETPFFVLNCSK